MSSYNVIRHETDCRGFVLERIVASEVPLDVAEHILHHAEMARLAANRIRYSYERSECSPIQSQETPEQR